MPEKRREFDREFREGAVRIVRESGKPIAQVARDLGVHEGTLGNWVSLEDRQGGGLRCLRDISRPPRTRRPRSKSDRLSR
jgi:transposase